MAFGQIAAAALVDRVLDAGLPLAWIAVAPCLEALSNFWLSRREHTSEHAAPVAASALIGWLFVLDTLGLTAVLMLTGGPTNPLSLLYLVYITLSAMILNQRQTWALGLLASLCFALLFWRYRPIAALEMHHHGEGVNVHLFGMWLGFAIAALLVAMFSGRISSLLRQHEQSLLRMQEELARKDRLASLVTLAAGAAHELSTPLATIAVVAKDLERYATRTLGDGALAEDSRLIRTEVERCRTILQRLSVEGAEPAGEAIEAVNAGVLVSAAQLAFASGSVLRVEASQEDLQSVLKVPRHAVQQAIVALVKNAVEASPEGSSVSLATSRSPESIRFEVKDSGTGMSQETLRHAGEPFFTTKEPGRGMGLGIFLVRTLADRLGGRLTFDSSPAKGTCAVLELPLERTARAEG
jgi:two-component system sensor histidine kinase RegB